ncbi:MAG TPA: hypothetical protein VL418_13845 [Devosiaceae bacterium]|jgi:hypothetical protein|nr:hypothetical protein [Devosiaceae bacterium]
MSKFTTVASLAVAVVGFATMSGSSAIAACLNPADTSNLSMTSSLLAPNEEGSHQRLVRQAELAQGNQCDLAQATYSTSAADTLNSHPNESGYHEHNRG